MGIYKIRHPRCLECLRHRLRHKLLPFGGCLHLLATLRWHTTAQTALLLYQTRGRKNAVKHVILKNLLLRTRWIFFEEIPSNTLRSEQNCTKGYREVSPFRPAGVGDSSFWHLGYTPTACLYPDCLVIIREFWARGYSYKNRNTMKETQRSRRKC